MTGPADGHYIRRSVQTHRYVVIPNAAVQNKSLSFRARGMLAAILSLPPQTRLTADALCEMATEGRDAIRTAMRELREAGYAVLRKHRGADGRVTSWTEVFDTPVGNHTDTEAENPTADAADSLFDQVTPGTEDQPAGNPSPSKVRTPSNKRSSVVTVVVPYRIPDDFQPSDRSIAALEHYRPDVDWRAETRRFVAYWHAQPGKKGEKSDWQLTWRNWMKRARGGNSTNGVAPETGTYSPYKSDW